MMIMVLVVVYEGFPCLCLCVSELVCALSALLGYFVLVLSFLLVVVAFLGALIA